MCKSGPNCKPKKISYIHVIRNKILNKKNKKIVSIELSALQCSEGLSIGLPLGVTFNFHVFSVFQNIGCKGIKLNAA
jgi:hypothetical protein